jgi:inhibitor of KinA
MSVNTVLAPAWPIFTPVADHALLVSFADAISDEASAAVLSLDRALAHAPPAGMVECLPALVSLLIDFDPLVTDHARMEGSIERLLRTPAVAVQANGTLHEVEVCYAEALSPDLAAVAQSSGLSIDAVINCHACGDYQVRMYGFAPGYAYLSGVSPDIQVPRKRAAVRDVPSGSVLIAGPQCLVSTLVMPTGWSIIGRSPTRILTEDEDAPFLFSVGDKVRFKRIDLALYEAHVRRTRGE